MNKKRKGTEEIEEEVCDQLSPAKRRQIIETRKQCKLVDLLLYSDSEKLTPYVKNVKDSLILEGIIPVDPDNEHGRHNEYVDFMFTEAIEKDDVVLKKYVILMGLWFSNDFVSMFCPQTGSSGFLIDSGKLRDMLKDPEFVALISGVFSGKEHIRSFVAKSAAEWIKRDPWERMSLYRSLDPKQMSIEHKLLTGNTSDIPASASLTYNIDIVDMTKEAEKQKKDTKPTSILRIENKKK